MCRSVKECVVGYEIEVGCYDKLAKI